MSRINFQSKVIAAFVASAILNGIIGNRADAWLVENTPAFFSEPVTIKVSWFVFILGWTFTIPFLFAIRNGAALTNVSNLVKVVGLLSGNIISFYQPIPNRPEAEKEAKRFAKTLLRAIAQNRPFKGCDAAIFYPEQNEPYLRLWQLQSDTPLAFRPPSFYIGDEPQPNERRYPRGVAGKTFSDGTTRIVHFQNDGLADDIDFLPVGEKPPYRSMICTAIPSLSEERKSLGVFCLYSYSARTFDNDGIVMLVESLASRFSIVLLAF